MTVPADKDCRSWPVQPDAPLKGRSDGGSPLNSRPAGEVTITGSEVEGQTLNATENLTDADGLGTKSFQWFRETNPIAAAVTAALLLVSADVGSRINCRVSYTDNLSQSEQKTSSWTAVVAALSGGQNGYVYSDVNYPLAPDNPTPDVADVGEIFYNETAVGLNDGSSPANGFTDATTAFNDLTGNANTRILTCIGEFVIPVGGIDGNAKANSDGTQGNEIVFRAHPTLGCNINATNGTIDMGGWNRWIISDFTSTGGANVFRNNGSGISTQPSNYITFRNLDMTLGVMSGSNNAGALFLGSGASYSLDWIGVFNCKIFGAGADGGNGACLYITVCKNMRIMNNELTNAEKPIYYKHPNEDGIFYEAIIENNSIGWNGVGNTRLSMNKTVFRNNLLWNKQVTINDNGGGLGADDNTFENNTGYLRLEETNTPADNNILRNNVFRSLVLNPYDAADIKIDSDWNLFPGERINHRGSSVDNYDLAGWQAVNLAVSGFQDANSLARSATNVFVGGTQPTTIAGWALASPAIGSDGNNIGVDVSVIGTGIP